ncbi:MAG TPA: hypothetical protein VK841_13055, partial [Polyangiaceae bacterium]|nr:hypothetical protein [Polyangiaceae bacterium]
MLFAAVSRLGREAIAVAVNAVIDKVGEPAGTVVSDSSALCAWPPGSLDAARSQCVEGYCDLEGEPSFDTISGARGDFVLLALR